MKTLSEGVRSRCIRLAILTLSALAFSVSAAAAHDVTPGDAGYIQEIWGVHIIPFIYLGAKHMITGYDHILFLLGVVFFLYRMKDVAIYVSLFALGHSVTMLLGVWFGWGINAYIIDAIIGLSVGVWLSQRPGSRADRFVSYVAAITNVPVRLDIFCPPTVKNP